MGKAVSSRDVKVDGNRVFTPSDTEEKVNFVSFEMNRKAVECLQDGLQDLAIEGTIVESQNIEVSQGVSEPCIEDIAHYPDLGGSSRKISGSHQKDSD